VFKDTFGKRNLEISPFLKYDLCDFTFITDGEGTITRVVLYLVLAYGDDKSWWRSLTAMSETILLVL